MSDSGVSWIVIMTGIKRLEMSGLDPFSRRQTGLRIRTRVKLDLATFNQSHHVIKVVWCPYRAACI